MALLLIKIRCNLISIEIYKTPSNNATTSPNVIQLYLIVFAANDSIVATAHYAIEASKVKLQLTH